MRWAWLACVIATASGCGVGRLVHPEEPLVLGDDTLLVLVVRTNEYATLQFCRDGDLGSCLTTPQFSREPEVQVYALPPGRYCLMHMDVDPATGAGVGIHIDIPADRSECFVAEPGLMAYPGDLYIDAHPTQGIYWRVLPRWSREPDIEDRLFARYPDLRGRSIQISRPIPFDMPH